MREPTHRLARYERIGSAELNMPPARRAPAASGGRKKTAKTGADAADPANSAPATAPATATATAVATAPATAPATAAATDGASAADDGTDVSLKDEQVILQMPLSNERIHDLLYQDNLQTLMEYNPTLTEPTPYDPKSSFVSNPLDMDQIPQTAEKPAELPPPIETSVVRGLCADPTSSLPKAKATGRAKSGSSAASATATGATGATGAVKKQHICFHCCHEIGHMCFGMPTRYDGHTETFTTYGNFCSLECAAAFNFSTHMGSDRAWEIHGWIQMLGRRYGFAEPIRPAPARYLLEMFDGPLTIEQFRRAHATQTRTLVLNIPPMISLPSQLESINTSYWTGSVGGAPGAAITTAGGNAASGAHGIAGVTPSGAPAITLNAAPTISGVGSGAGASAGRQRKVSQQAPPPGTAAASVLPKEHKRTLDAKLNLTITTTAQAPHAPLVVA